MHALTCRLLFWLSAIYNNCFRFTAVYVQGHLNSIVSAVSRVCEPSKMCSLLPSSPAGAINHANLLTSLHWLSLSLYVVAISVYPGSKDPQLAQQLQEKIYQYHFRTFTKGTKVLYRTHTTSKLGNCYLQFCEHMGYPPSTAQSSHFCQYAAFLARSLKTTSIPNYRNICGIWHKEFNLPNPLLNNWPLQSFLTGSKCVNSMLPCPKTTHYS